MGELDLLRRQSVGSSQRSYEFEGRQWALAIDAAAQVSVYRPDLIAEPPRNFDEIAQVGRAGQMIMPLDPTEAISSYCSLAANSGNPIGSEEGSFIDAGAGVELLSTLKEFSRLVRIDA